MKKLLKSLLIIALIVFILYIYYKYNTNNNIDIIKYNPWNIIYIDADGKEFTWIWTITLHYKNKDITILDRNLWATTNNINSWDSYWYYFQWWNNYWFSLKTWEIIIEEKQVDVSWYWASKYTNPTFIIWEYWERMTDYYTNWKNLRWWWLDSQENSRWLTWDINIEQRQWPCPTGYHIPSIWEWNELTEFRIDLYKWKWENKECIFMDNNWFIKIPSNDSCHNEKILNDFFNAFKLPQAWYLVYRNLYHNSSDISLQTSTFRYKFWWTKESIWPLWENEYANAMPIRCFADTNL